jgi:hypothetical protein
VIAENGAVLCITIDWMPNQMSLEDLRTWVYVSKYRKTKIGVTRGWSFSNRGNSIFAEEAVSLAELSNFLVQRTDECPSRIHAATYNFHFTTAFLSGPITDKNKRETLMFQLAHQVFFKKKGKKFCSKIMKLGRQ